MAILHLSAAAPPPSPTAPSPACPQLAPTLLPELLLIVRTDEYGPSLQRRALSILHCVVGTLHVLTSSHPKEVRALVAAMAADWFAEFSRLLGKPLGADVSVWAAVLGCACGGRGSGAEHGYCMRDPGLLSFAERRTAASSSAEQEGSGS